MRSLVGRGRFETCPYRASPPWSFCHVVALVTLRGAFSLLRVPGHTPAFLCRSLGIRVPFRAAKGDGAPPLWNPVLAGITVC